MIVTRSIFLKFVSLPFCASKKFGHRIRVCKRTKNKSFILLFKLSTIFPVMVPEYIDIPVILLAQKFKVKKKIKKRTTQHNLKFYVSVFLRNSFFLTSFIILSILFSIVLSFISMT